MPAEPTRKRVVAFVDGQNLFHNARQVFGYTYPNYDVKKLSESICEQHGWELVGVQFYTGVPAYSDNPFWHDFWSNRLTAMGRTVKCYSRPLVYRTKMIEVPGHGKHSFVVGEEKGIDVRLALDAIDAAHRGDLDVALIFSQDQDLSELAEMIRKVARLQNRWIKIASAYPIGPHAMNRRGINSTDWCPFDKATYESVH